MNTDAITIEYGSGTLTAEDFVDDGFILEENLCSASQIAFGACEAAAVEVHIASTAASFVGKTLNVKLGENALGNYKVVSDERASDGETRILKAYDALYDINGQDVAAWYESIDWNVVTTLKQFRESFFRYLGITQATANLVNDGMPVKKTMDATSCSGATILQAICEINGVFGHMNANGQFQYVSLSEGNAVSVNDDEVLDTMTEDFTVPAFDGVLVRTEEGDIGGQYPASGAQNQYIITGNFLCYGKTTAELQSIAQNALSKIGDKTYVPFEAELECQGNIALGGKVTIPTEPATFTSYVLQRKLVGFEDLEEYFVAQGSPEYVPDVNSARNQMVATSQRINKLTSTVEGTESRVAEIEKDYAKESVIKQLPHEILLQASETSESGTPQKATITLTVKDGKGSVVSTEAVDILFNGLVTFTNNAKQAAIDAAATDATNKTKTITDHIYKTGTTTINGGIIDTESLFSRDITATNMNITGGSMKVAAPNTDYDYFELTSSLLSACISPHRFGLYTKDLYAEFDANHIAFTSKAAQGFNAGITYSQLENSNAGNLSIYANQIYLEGEIFENGTSLVNKYAAKSHTHTKSQITDFPTSMPASDVYAWAKASTKPRYTASEVGAAPASGSMYYTHVYNSSNVGSNTSTATFNTMAASGGNSQVGMIYPATDNPAGKANWHHVWSQSWDSGVNTSWVSQIAIGLESGNMYYRTNGGSTIVGKAWTRLAKASEIPSISGLATQASVNTKISKPDKDVGSATTPIYYDSATGAFKASTYDLSKFAQSDLGYVKQIQVGDVMYSPNARGTVALPSSGSGGSGGSYSSTWTTLTITSGTSGGGGTVDVTGYATLFLKGKCNNSAAGWQTMTLPINSIETSDNYYAFTDGSQYVSFKMRRTVTTAGVTKVTISSITANQSGSISTTLYAQK